MKIQAMYYLLAGRRVDGLQIIGPTGDMTFVFQNPATGALETIISASQHMFQPMDSLVGTTLTLTGPEWPLDSLCQG